jgi:DNA-binding NtrC family response regulator
MSKYLFSWIGKTDLRVAGGSGDEGIGPVAQAASDITFSDIVLLSDHSTELTELFVNWLKRRVAAKILVRPLQLSNPMHFGEVYEGTRNVLREFTADKRSADLTFHVSPGTPVMAATWIILAKTCFNATLIESSVPHGTRILSVPFDISADYLADLLKKPDDQLSGGLISNAPEFSLIIHRSAAMQLLLKQAHKVARRGVTVLIQGESGTGKEGLARAIHDASSRRGKFIPVNCGAIPEQLADGLLFGYRKGAFTGADRDQPGYFEAANGGTLFLDEIGELPSYLQVKLLRVLQERRVQRIGEHHERDVDVRIIAATNRNLLQEVAAGTFREDLYFRLAVMVLDLPPLRERKEDINPLIDHILGRINKEATAMQPGYQAKQISVVARNRLKRYSWPGNIRELENVLERLAIWTEKKIITEDEVKATLRQFDKGLAEVLDRPIGNGFRLDSLLKEVEKHYVERALRETGGNKSKAATMLGFNHYQTFTKRLEKISK